MNKTKTTIKVAIYFSIWVILAIIVAAIMDDNLLWLNWRWAWVAGVCMIILFPITANIRNNMNSRRKKRLGDDKGVGKTRRVSFFDAVNRAVEANGSGAFGAVRLTGSKMAVVMGPVFPAIECSSFDIMGNAFKINMDYVNTGNIETCRDYNLLEAEICIDQWEVVPKHELPVLEIGYVQYAAKMVAEGNFGDVPDSGDFAFPLNWDKAFDYLVNGKVLGRLSWSHLPNAPMVFLDRWTLMMVEDIPDNDGFFRISQYRLGDEDINAKDWVVFLDLNPSDICAKSI